MWYDMLKKESKNNKKKSMLIAQLMSESAYMCMIQPIIIDKNRMWLSRPGVSGCRILMA